MHAQGAHPDHPEPCLAIPGDEQRSGQGGLIVNAKSFWVMALSVAGLGVGSAILGCQKEAAQASEVSRRTRRPLPTKAAADRAAAEQVGADKANAQRASADKAAADKAAADKAAAQAKAEAASLPPDLVEMKAEITRMTAQMDLTMANSTSSPPRREISRSRARTRSRPWTPSMRRRRS
jgi:hypothetical protein